MSLNFKTMQKITEPTEYYNNLKEENENIAAKHGKVMNQLTLVRLVTFVSIFVVFFILHRFQLGLALSAAGFILIVFLFSVVRYQRTKKSKDFHQAIVDICKLEEAALNHNYSNFNDGSEYIDYKHPYSFDLDLFGNKSLFQYLNRTSLHPGSLKLAAKLKKFETAPVKIKKLQDGIKELSGNIDFCINFRANGALISELQEEYERLNKWLKDAYPLKHRKIYKILAFTLPVFTLGSAILAAFIPFFQGIAVMFFLNNLFLLGMSFKKINVYNASLSPVLKLLTKYHKLLSLVEKESWESEHNSSLRNTLLTGHQSASESIAKLNKYVNSFDQRINMVMAVFLEGFLLWDFHFIEKIEHWKEVYGKYFPEWMDVISEYDAQISMATFAFNNKDFVYPEISNAVILTAEGMGHPLIPGSERVVNDFMLTQKGQFAIITGANMSGKSTFLRTVAINTILAGTGMPVCATSLFYTPMILYTSMRTSDSLAKNESYFYAELVRLKELLEILEADSNVFIILDEILKGTNSHDKQNGSRMVMEKILKLSGTGIIATHDLELTKIENEYPDKISNHCFEIEIDDAEINFDYKLQHGVTQKMNAILLMKQMGIV